MADQQLEIVIFMGKGTSATQLGSPLQLGLPSENVFWNSGIKAVYAVTCQSQGNQFKVGYNCDRAINNVAICRPMAFTSAFHGPYMFRSTFMH